MKVVVIDYNDGKELMDLWTELTCLMDTDDGPSLDSSDNKFSKIYMNLNSWLHEKIFRHMDQIDDKI